MEEGTCPNITKISNVDKNYVCIKYPGLVLNVDKALETLGGIEKISSCHGKTNRRLELRFRSDIYAKPACADKTNTSDLLVKVTQVKKRSKFTGEVKTEYHVHVLGTVATTYHFSTMCDFQYLPMTRNYLGRYESMLPDLTTPDLVERDYLQTPCPLFLTPPTFSRMDTPQDYHFRREVRSDNQPSNFISRVRQRRSLHAIFLNFEDEFVPSKPREVAVKQLPVKLVTQEQIDLVKQLFQQRSVWSKAALTAHLPSNFPQAKLKAILPIVSFYFVTGPWRNSWVKLGFDPRKTPDARFWQTLDYRLRKAGGAYSKVVAKRSYVHYTMPYRTSNISKTRALLINKKLLNQSGQEEVDKDSSLTEEEAVAKLEDTYIFRPGRIPPARQMFYQCCDLKVPEIEALLLQAPVNEICDEKNGWFPPGTDDAVRAILTRCVREQCDKDDNVASGGEEEDDDEPAMGSDINESSSEEEELGGETA